MLTGDHPTTAVSIAKSIGILPTDSQGRRDAMTATEFDAIPDEELDKMERLPRVIARCSPLTKGNYSKMDIVSNYSTSIFRSQNGRDFAPPPYDCYHDW
jgi:magnesium-transporting ATPase (P-type)